MRTPKWFRAGGFSLTLTSAITGLALLGIGCGGDSKKSLKKWESEITQMGLITGLVTDAETGQPIGDVDIDVGGGKRVRTNVDGQFETVAPAGRTRVKVESQDHLKGGREIAVGGDRVELSFKLLRKGESKKVGRMGGTVNNKQAQVEIPMGAFRSDDATVSVTFTPRQRVSSVPVQPQYIDDSGTPRRVVAAVTVQSSEPPMLASRARVPVSADATVATTQIVELSEDGEILQSIVAESVSGGMATFPIKNDGLYGVVIDASRADSAKVGYLVLDEGDSGMSDGQVLTDAEVTPSRRTTTLVDPQGATVEIAPASRVRLEVPVQKPVTMGTDEMAPYAGKVSLKEGLARVVIPKLKEGKTPKGVRFALQAGSISAQATGTAYSLKTCGGGGGTIYTLEVLEGTVKVVGGGPVPQSVVAKKSVTFCVGCSSATIPACMAVADGGMSLPPPPPPVRTDGPVIISLPPVIADAAVAAVDGPVATPIDASASSPDMGAAVVVGVPDMQPAAPPVDAAAPNPKADDAGVPPKIVPDMAMARPMDDGAAGGGSDAAATGKDAPADMGPATDDAFVMSGPDAVMMVGDDAPVGIDMPPPVLDVGGDQPSDTTPPDLGPMTDGPTAALIVNVTMFGFGSVAIGGTSTAALFNYTNKGSAATKTLMSLLEGTNMTEFMITNDGCGGFPLLPNQQCQVSVAFKPTSNGTKFAALRVTDGETFALSNLDGMGATPAALTIMPDPVTFPVTPVMSASMPIMFTVANKGGADTGIPILTLKGPTPGDYSIINNLCMAPIPAATGTCTFEVQFHPMAPGGRNADVEVVAAPGGAYTARMYGSGGPQFAIMPAALGVGDVAIGSSKPLLVTIKNLGDMRSQIFTTTLMGPDLPDFTIPTPTNFCMGQLLPAGGMCTLELLFAPATVGAKNVNLTVGDTNSTNGAMVNGNGVMAPNIAVVPPSFNFGDGKVGGQTGDLTVWAMNVGGAPTGALTVTLAGTDAAQFYISQGNCVDQVLAPNTQQLCSTKLQFKPTQTGLKTATLTIAGNPGGMKTVMLQGNALTAPALSIMPGTSLFANQQVGSSSAPQMFTIKNESGAAIGPLDVKTAMPDGSSFPITGDLCSGMTLNMAQTCTVQVSFNPGVPGPRTSSVEVAAGGGGMVVAPLAGVGTP